MTTADLAEQVRRLSDDGLDDRGIAQRLGVPVARVERILDQAVHATQTAAAQPATAIPVSCFHCDWTAAADDMPHGRRLFAEHWKAEHRAKPAAPAEQEGLLTEYRVVWPDGTTNDISAAVAQLAPRIGGTVITRHVQAWTAPSIGAAG